MSFQTTISRSPEAISAENARFMSKVYLWMTFGILISAVVSYLTASNEPMRTFVFGNSWVFMICVVLELVLVVALSAAIKKMSALVATLVFLFYSALSGLTLASIFLIYTKGMIAQAFGLTAFSFAGLSAFGFVTKRDLGPIGSFCMMGLFGMIAYGLLALFFPSMLGGIADQVYSSIGIIVFAGLTAYDTQKIKMLNIIGNEGTEEDHKEAIMGALTLYLDFINLFLMILRLMGGGRSRD